MIYLGIDPGFEGALAVIDSFGSASVYDVPIMTVERGGKKRREYDEASAVALLRDITKDEYLRPVHAEAAIERVHAMPKAGAVGMFSFGEGYMMWKALLAAFGIPKDLVEPARWKKAMLDGMGKEKQAARFRAQQLFPALANQFTLVKHHGRAEALLIAEYRRRIG